MQYFTRLILLLIVIVGNIILLSSYIPYNRHLQANATSTSKTIPFIASVDTMKESRDTQTHPLSDITIAQDVNLSTSLHTTHITDRKSTRLNSSHQIISYAVFCLKKKIT